VNDSGPLRFAIRAPATSGNMGAGFDCLALTLDLWNVMSVELDGEGISVELQGEFTEHLPVDDTNMIVHTMLRHLRQLQVPRPRGLKITCTNNIPPASGLGSSSSAQALGLMAAGAIAGQVLEGEELLRRLAILEGHADNAAAVALGGLVLVAGHGDDYIWRSYEVPQLTAVVVTPPSRYSTTQARALLPQAVPLADAVFNMGRVPLIMEALRNGDLDLMREVMTDRLHQRYRLALTPGAEEALTAALEAGAAGAVVSGSGPSLLAFVCDEAEAKRVGEAMLEEYRVYELEAAVRMVCTSNAAAGVVGAAPAAD
jgi:homoserine kinase